jgi:ketosteroid isomerase-like protein
MPESIDARLRQFLSNLVSRKHTDLLEMLTEDAVMEFPYHPPTTPAQLVGKHEIVQFYSGFGDFLTLHETRLVAAHQTTTPNVAILEYEGISWATQTERPYLQKYLTVLTFRQGRISHWTDYWNPVSVLNATGEPGSAPSPKIAF